MLPGIIEIIGAFLVLTGLCTVVAGCVMVSTVLAVLVSGAFVVLLGVIAVYVAAQLELAGQEPKQPA